MIPSQSASLPPRAPSTRLSREVGKSLSSVVAYAVYLPVSLLVVRFVVERIGLASFGVWAALTTVAGYGALLDLGMAASLVKYVAEYEALDKRAEINALISTALSLYIVLGSVVAGLMIIPSPWVLQHILHVPSSDSTAEMSYVLVLVGFVGTLANGAVQSVVIGLRRNDLAAWISLVVNLISAVTTVGAVSLGYGVEGLVWSWLGTVILTIVANWIAARALLPSLRLKLFRFHLSQLRTIIGFASRVQVTMIALVFNDQVDRTLIAYALGPTLLGSYQLASRVTVAVRGLSFALVTGAVAAATDLAASGEIETLRTFAIRSCRYVAITDFGLCALVGCMSGPIVQVWLGPGHQLVAGSLVVILAGYAIWLPEQPADSALYAIGRPDIRMKADLGFLCLHVPLCGLLLWRFGYYGTLVGSAAALALTRSYVYRMTGDILGIGSWCLVRLSFLQPAIAAILAIGAAIAISNVETQPVAAAILELLGFFLVYTIYVLKFALEADERVYLVRTVRSVRSLRFANRG